MRLHFKATEMRSPYNESSFDYDDDVEMLITAGCDCCTHAIAITETTLAEAIQEAREWLEYLEGLQ
jgi:hypothetical protein